MREQDHYQQMAFERHISRKWILSRVAHIAFLVLGALISLAVFFGVQSFVDTISSGSYKRIAKETSETLAKEVSELEFSLRTVSTLVALSDENDDQAIAEKLGSVGQSLARFQYVLWVNRGSDGAWKVAPLHIDPAARDMPDYRKFYQRPDIKRILSSRNLQTKNAVNIISVLDDEAGKENSPYLFALVKPVYSGNKGTGAIVAITDLKHVFGQTALNIDPLVSQISIRDLNGNHLLFSFEQNRSQGASEYDGVEIYDLQFADHVLGDFQPVLQAKEFVCFGAVPLFSTGIWFDPYGHRCAVFADASYAVFAVCRYE